MTDLPNWFADLPFAHQVVVLASLGPCVAIVAATASLTGVLGFSPLKAAAIAFLLGEVPAAIFLRNRVLEGH